MIHISSEEHQKLISAKKYQELISELSHLLKEHFSLKQENSKQQQQFKSSSEELYLELLEVMDTVESLLNYVTESPEISPQFLKRLPRSISGIQQKLLDVLQRRQVCSITPKSIIADFQMCRVIDYEIREDLEENTILKTVRPGFSIEEKILRPVEVIVSKKS
ncbi:nucleotide exchange factor GrpE [Prochlorothrix hollandica]|uniref:Molecular chaperone GrpE n=1 Tax=Prochlorothrix hollandica PCC 9006 = CALU 1027 TaxID=317619 RepID=A0A0M2PTQ5_PROHO|nr:nucleotide exchange factor GrpE [Prochlorothrix hollandica]KKI98053.1 hypothetical protein PROH_20140 [Prochlorothrix hollandica PCC 9006 = CALU 1027]